MRYNVSYKIIKEKNELPKFVVIDVNEKSQIPKILSDAHEGYSIHIRYINESKNANSTLI